MQKMQVIVNKLRALALPLTWDTPLNSYPTAVLIELGDATRAERMVLANWLMTNLPTDKLLSIDNGGVDPSTGEWYPYIDVQATHVLATWQPKHSEGKDHVHIVVASRTTGTVLYDFMELHGLPPMEHKGVKDQIDLLLHIAVEQCIC